MLLPSIVPNRSIAIFLLIAGFCSRIDAQELPTASWRSGISRWAGSGYADAGLPGTDHEIKSTDVETPSTDLEKPDQVSSPEPDGPIAEPPTPFLDLGTKEETSDQTEQAAVVGHPIDDTITDKTGNEEDSTNLIDSDSTDSLQVPFDSVVSSPASFGLGLSESDSSWHSKVISLWSNTWTGIRWLEGWDSQAELGLDSSSEMRVRLGSIQVWNRSGQRNILTLDSISITDKREPVVRPLRIMAGSRVILIACFKELRMLLSPNLVLNGIDLKLLICD